MEVFVVNERDDNSERAIGVFKTQKSAQEYIDRLLNHMSDREHVYRVYNIKQTWMHNS